MSRLSRRHYFVEFEFLAAAAERNQSAAYGLAVAFVDAVRAVRENYVDDRDQGVERDARLSSTFVTESGFDVKQEAPATPWGNLWMVQRSARSMVRDIDWEYQRIWDVIREEFAKQLNLDAAIEEIRRKA
jgi:hypothetical protein